MAVIIVGVEASYGSCSSLILLERTLYTGNPCQENAILEPGAVAGRATTPPEELPPDHVIGGQIQLGQ